MALAVCLHSNIADEEGKKRLRGETFEASEKWISEIIAGDEAAGRPVRITLVAIPSAKRGRPRKEAENEIG
jgi:hypothetical protein